MKRLAFKKIADVTEDSFITPLLGFVRVRSKVLPLEEISKLLISEFGFKELEINDQMEEDFVEIYGILPPTKFSEWQDWIDHLQKLERLSHVPTFQLNVVVDQM